ncbi:hypothetical protein K7W42_13680 [Deinococcus sp. HMF7604]|uniref:hypothetical protein n=1 Tax=Deinococcus betulae TaxID=2873312 RepID=UPI001CCAA9C1|nr:hypothetical protein [Deinococcus betulae]MBZ9751906.1 hypothetical protein [Deinococcus betulae]
MDVASAALWPLLIQLPLLAVMGVGLGLAGLRLHARLALRWVVLASVLLGACGWPEPSSQRNLAELRGVVGPSMELAAAVSVWLLLWAPPQGRSVSEILPLMRAAGRSGLLLELVGWVCSLMGLFSGRPAGEAKARGQLNHC